MDIGKFIALSQSLFDSYERSHSIDQLRNKSTSTEVKEPMNENDDSTFPSSSPSYLAVPQSTTSDGLNYYPIMIFLSLVVVLLTVISTKNIKLLTKTFIIIVVLVIVALMILYMRNIKMSEIADRISSTFAKVGNNLSKATREVEQDFDRGSAAAAAAAAAVRQNQQTAAATTS